MEKFFAVLIGKNGDYDDTTDFIYKISRLPVILGRDPNSEGSIQLTAVDSLMSRQHCKIEWDESNREFVLTALSRNSTVVDKQLVPQNTSCTLHHGSAIRVGRSRFYFQVAIPSD